MELRNYLQPHRLVLARGAAPIERVLSRVDKDESTGCWNFQGAKNEAGYGIVGLGGRGEGVDRSHRIAYRHFIGEIPKGIFVCHKCDNRACCNPDHLFLGTAKDNTKDMLEKQRGSKPPRNEHDHGSYRYNAKLTEELVSELRARNKAGESGYSIWKSLKNTCGVSMSVVYRVLSGKTWRHVNA